jgi:hypothetical protein
MVNQQITMPIIIDSGIRPNHLILAIKEQEMMRVLIYARGVGMASLTVTKARATIEKKINKINYSSLNFLRC